MKNRWFTLAEILIVVMLFGMLAGLIMQTYTTISQVSFRLHQEKEIAKEALMLSQVLENLAQTTTINHGKYNTKDLTKNNWIVDTLYLKGNNGEEYQILSTGECLSSSDLYNWTSKKENNSDSENSNLCALEMITTNDNSSQSNLLLNGNNFKLTKVKFKIIPFIWNSELKGKLQNTTSEDDLKNLPDGWQPAFWLLGSLYSNYYQPNKRSNNIILPLQLFFSLQGETENLYSNTNTNATENSEA